MKRIPFEPTPEATKGLGWWKWRGGSFVFVRCPNDHTHSVLTPGGSSHTVADDGAVMPSMVCPSCDYHEFVKLEGWTP